MKTRIHFPSDLLRLIMFVIGLVFIAASCDVDSHDTADTLAVVGCLLYFMAVVPKRESWDLFDEYWAKTGRWW